MRPLLIKTVTVDFTVLVFGVHKIRDILEHSYRSYGEYTGSISAESTCGRAHSANLGADASPKGLLVSAQSWDSGAVFPPPNDIEFSGERRRVRCNDVSVGAVFALPAHFGFSSKLLLHSQAHDSPDEGVRDRPGERELEISFWPRIRRERLFELRVAGHRRIKADVILEGGEVHQDAELPERRHAITDEFIPNMPSRKTDPMAFPAGAELAEETPQAHQPGG